MRPSQGAGHTPVWPAAPPVEQPPVPVVYRDEGPGVEAETTWVRPVLPGPEPARPIEVPRTVVRVEDVSTEVEQHPEGDYPAGSIFAPGRTWGVEAEQHDLDTEQEPIVAFDWGDFLSGSIDVLQGQYPGGANPLEFNPLGYMGPTATTIPSGAAALPPSAAPVTTGTGDACGNRRYVTLDRQTGKISCKRRRRRRLLTNRDLADLASLKTITGGGAALNAAVIRAVR